MSESLYESEILKSLEALDNILTKSDQIQPLEPGSHRPVGVDWSGSDPEEQEEKDATPDGTDYVPVKKGLKKAEAREEADVDEYRRGKDEGEDEKRSERADVDKYEYEEGKKAAKEEEEEDMDKAGYAAWRKSQSAVRSGVEVSEFLNELTKSIALYCAELENFVVKSLEQLHEENGAMSKAIAENLVALDDLVQKSQGNITEYAEGPARGPKSMLDMSKSIVGSEEPELSKSVVINALMKGVEAGTVSPLEIIKVEQFGVNAVNQDVVKSLLA